MGEILFRGKRVDNCEIIESGSIQQLNDGYKVYLWYQGEWIEVIPNTVGQYSGLTDMNGKKVFDGDIMQLQTLDTNETRRAACLYGEFEYEDEMFLGWYLSFEGYKISILQEGEELLELCEIIGNINDNPELLKTEE